jgi:hypothetical protein
MHWGSEGHVTNCKSSTNLIVAPVSSAKCEGGGLVAASSEPREHPERKMCIKTVLIALSLLSSTAAFAPQGIPRPITTLRGAACVLRSP